jgi:putative transposase
MPRIDRLSVPGVPMHVVQRGNNRQACFFHAMDYRYYRDSLFASAARYNVAVHAFVLMTNHVHMLVTPSGQGFVSRMMQRLSSTYVTHVNVKYGRSGTLWEGRFKSSLVESEKYCLACYRYIELNPVRAGMCHDPGDYPWSSYRVNALGARNPGLAPHAEWLALSMDDAGRCARYRALVQEGADSASDSRIRFGLQKGLPTGSQRFKKQIEDALARRIGDGYPSKGR